MSRIGRRPIPLPESVQVELGPETVQVRGPKGRLEIPLPPRVRVEQVDGELRVVREDDRKSTRALHGLARALLANMVTGVTEGFTVELVIEGVGYRAQTAGQKLELTLGFSHPVSMDIPEGIEVSVEQNTRIRIHGIDRQAVGQFAAVVRRLRPPEPYKGKGIRYATERVRRKVGKAGAA